MANIRNTFIILLYTYEKTEMEYLYPDDVWNIIKNYLLDFQETHRRQSSDVRTDLCLRPPPRRRICVYSKFPPFPFYVFRHQIYELYSLSHHLEKCSDYAKTWQPLRTWAEFVPKQGMCPYSQEEIQARWNAYRVIS